MSVLIVKRAAVVPLLSSLVTEVQKHRRRRPVVEAPLISNIHTTSSIRMLTTPYYVYMCIDSESRNHPSKSLSTVEIILYVVM